MYALTGPLGKEPTDLRFQWMPGVLNEFKHPVLPGNEAVGFRYRYPEPNADYSETGYTGFLPESGLDDCDEAWVNCY